MLGVNVRGSTWLRLRTGIYVKRADFQALPAWERYAVRVHAFLRMHPGAILCLESAAVVHGIPRFGETKDIHIYDPDRSSSTRHGDIVIHTSCDARAVEQIGGVLVTSLIDTVADLARLVPPAHGLAMADAAISPVQGGTLQVVQLRQRIAGQQNARGRARLSWVCDNADGRSESVGESVSRAVIGWSGFEQPVLQQRFSYEGCDDRVDFFFPSCGAIGESDGWSKYDFGDPEKAERRLRDEKRREDRLRRHGHPFARWDFGEAWQVDPLCSALVSAGVRKVESADALMLATLRSNPRARRENRSAA